MKPQLGDDAVLDMQNLFGRCMGKLDLVERVLRVFQERCEADLAQLEESVAVGDLSTAAQLAHRMKGASGNASARAFCASAAAVERAARGDDLDQLSMHLEELRQEWSRVEAAVSDLQCVSDRAG